MDLLFKRLEKWNLNLLQFLQCSRLIHIHKGRKLSEVSPHLVIIVITVVPLLGSLWEAPDGLLLDQHDED